MNCFNPSGTCRQTFDLIKYPEILLQINNVGIFTYQGIYKYQFENWNHPIIIIIFY